MNLVGARTVKNGMPVLFDAYCGLGGWTDGFLAAGYYVIGLDIEEYPGYRGHEFVCSDAREWSGFQLRGVVDVMVASPPCGEFARFRQPWLRSQRLKPPDMSLVEAAYRLRDEILPRLFLLENVRSAQYFLGQALVAREPHYFWGDAALIPRVKMRQKQTYSSSQAAERSRIPYLLALGVAYAFKANTTCTEKSC